MKKILCLLIYVVMVLITNSCVKDPKVEHLVFVGKTKDMYVTQYSSTNPIKYPLNVDIDNDGELDFSLEGRYIHGNPFSYSTLFILKELNNKFMLSYKNTKHKIYEFYSEENARYDSFYNCYVHRDVYCTVCDSSGWNRYNTFKNTFVVNAREAYSINDRLESNANWIKDGIILLYEYHYSGPPTGYGNYKGDTMYLEYTYDYMDCIDFPKDKLFYLGIKKTVGNNSYLGWIKLNQSDNSGVKIFETAISKFPN